jgi:hypothetical protein
MSSPWTDIFQWLEEQSWFEVDLIMWYRKVPINQGGHRGWNYCESLQARRPDLVRAHDIMNILCLSSLKQHYALTGFLAIQRCLGFTAFIM